MLHANNSRRAHGDHSVADAVSGRLEVGKPDLQSRIAEERRRLPRKGRCVRVRRSATTQRRTVECRAAGGTYSAPEWFVQGLQEYQRDLPLD